MRCWWSVVMWRWCMPPLNMNMQQSATYTVRAFKYSTTLTRIFFDYVCIPVWASCLCPVIIRGFRVHNYSNAFQNFQFSLSKCCVSWYARRGFYPVTTIVCSVHSSPVAGSLRKQTFLPENICRGNCTKTGPKNGSVVCSECELLSIHQSSGEKGYTLQRFCPVFQKL